MPTLTMTIIILALTFVVLNAAVTWAVARSAYYSLAQKIAQAMIVWLVPFLGAILVAVFLYSQRDNFKFDTRAYPEPDQKARAIEIQEAIHGQD